MSRKNVSAIVSGAGWISGFASLLVQEMRRQGWTDEQIHSLVTESAPEKQPIQQIVSLLKGVDKNQFGPVYPVSVDYTCTLVEMIKAGKYDWVNDNITEKNFPIHRPSVSEAATGDGGPYRVPGVQNNGNIELGLVHLNKVASEEEVLRHLEQLGLRPAKIEELLAFGEKYPDIQREFPIVALGSRWRASDGLWCVAFLGRAGDKRDLSLSWLHLAFRSDCRFLVSRK